MQIPGGPGAPADSGSCSRAGPFFLLQLTWLGPGSGVIFGVLLGLFLSRTAPEAAVEERPLPSEAESPLRPKVHPALVERSSYLMEPGGLRNCKWSHRTSDARFHLFVHLPLQNGHLPGPKFADGFDSVHDEPNHLVHGRFRAFRGAIAWVRHPIGAQGQIETAQSKVGLGGDGGPDDCCDLVNLRNSEGV